MANKAKRSEKNRDGVNLMDISLIGTGAIVRLTSTMITATASVVVAALSVRLLGTHSTVGSHVLLNRGVLVGHHSKIEDHVSVQPGANIAGDCRIAEQVWVGIGAVVIDRISIGSGTVIGAGAVVTKDRPDHVLALGVPARIAKENVDNR